ncbi:MAG: DivIVA domain-containing protein [Candidatus Ancillula sp.]|jgi:DivIVA domain-containing protein|nr:DivIVA domain-containing protein [Candidatus Ancillula sp.]
MTLLTADDIRYKKFSLTHFRHGYDMDEVDEFLEEIIQSIDELTRLAQGAAVNTGAFSAVGSVNPPTLSDINNNSLVQGLRAENAGLQQKINEFLEQQSRGTGQFDNAQLLRDNQELVARLKQAEEEIENLTKQVNSKDASQSPHDAVAQIQKLANELTDLQRDYKAVVAKKQELDQEIEKLRQSSGVNAGDADALRIEVEQLKQQLDESNSHVARLQVKLQAAQSSDSDSLSAISNAASASAGGASQAAAMLNMAQQLHDEYVQKGKNEGAKLIEDARNESERLITTAQKEHEHLISTAQEENRRIISEAKETADLTYESLAKERSNIERKIDELRLFERDYRSRLKTFLENLLDDVDRREPNSILDDKRAKDILSDGNNQATENNAI